MRAAVGNERGPDPFGVRASAEQSLEGARLSASLSRTHLVLRSIKRAIARWDERTRGGSAHAVRLRRGGAREHTLTLNGSGCSDDVARIHDEAFRSFDGWDEARPFNEGRTVKSLYDPPLLLERVSLHSHQGHIVNRRRSNTSARPTTGSRAFVRVVAMAFTGACGGYPHAPRLAPLKRNPWVRRDDGRWHPGEGAA